MLIKVLVESIVEAVRLPSIAILITGLPGSGKSLFAEVAKSIGVPVISLGDVVREEVAKRGLGRSLEALISVAQELRAKLGLEAIAVLAIDRIKEALRESCMIVVDGIRSLEEVSFIKSSIKSEVLIVAVHASPKTRFARLVARGRAGDPKNWVEFVERDLKELAWGVGNVIALADVILVNEGEANEFKRRAHELLSEAIRRWCT